MQKLGEKHLSGLEKKMNAKSLFKLASQISLIILLIFSIINSQLAFAFTMNSFSGGSFEDTTSIGEDNQSDDGAPSPPLPPQYNPDNDNHDDVIKPDPGGIGEEPPDFGQWDEDGVLRRLDVLVVYTTEAKNDWAPFGGIQNQINIAINDLNESFINSNVNLEAALVHSQEVLYTESGDVQTDLPRLQNPADGFLDVAHDLREAHHADLVHLIVGMDTFGCGMSFVPDVWLSPTYVRQEWEKWMFSVSNSTCTSINKTFAHEIGHNLGLAHDRDHTSGPGSFDFSYGFLQSGNFRTIMAYGAPTVRINHFSNPDVLFNGVPTGISIQEEDSANNAFTLSLNAEGAISARVKPGDVNDDGFVNTQDLLLLLAHWGLDVDPYDIDNSSSVDTPDLLILLANWTS